MAYIKAPKDELQKYYDLLEEIRQSGICNMFGASQPLQDCCPELSAKDASKILVDWIEGHNDESRILPLGQTKWTRELKHIPAITFVQK